MDEKDLPNLSPEEIRDLKTQYNKAKDILEKINALSIRYDAAFKAFETRNIDTEKVANDIREKAVTVESVRDEATKLLTGIKIDLEGIQATIDKIDKSSVEFEGVKGRIAGKEGEMDALLSAAKGLRDDVEKAKITAQQRLTEIDGQFAKIQEKIAQMQDAYESFVAVHAKITDPKTGLQAILDQSVDLQKQSSTTFAEIKSFLEQSREYLETIKVNKTETDEIKQEAQKSLEQINLNKAEVEKITALITDTGFADSFQKRAKALRNASYIWLAILVLAIGGLAWMLIEYLLNVQGVPELSVLLYRVTLTSPLLFLIGISVKEYSNERSLNEKYAFKATIASVMRSHSKFLNEICEKKDMDNALFTRNILNALYVEPYEKGFDVKEIKNQIKSALEERNDIKKTKLRESIVLAKELKELIPDSDSLKSVIELLIKYK
jgi:hypothetical protein